MEQNEKARQFIMEKTNKENKPLLVFRDASKSAFFLSLLEIAGACVLANVTRVVNAAEGSGQGIALHNQQRTLQKEKAVSKEENRQEQEIGN